MITDDASGDRTMTVDRSATFEKRAIEGFLGVALQAALVRLGELSGSRAEEALDHFEHSLVRALRTLTGPEGAKLSTQTAVEDTIVILRKTIDAASRKVAESQSATMTSPAIAA
ncbi:hypothetical protein [Methylobacterium sp. WL6]|uniref:hypothetical protein n=1 Tax=Methylobacterium sp. WL6 TaxID=2603901 RepID=UPI0011C7EC27|nr:hypothetical protein [Methylobacterium sp. WL6]TXN69917.1 hypothetical protein FV230_11150 [Methylobacterium sp. WL6]